MLPSQSRRSVPVLMPLKLTSTSMSLASNALTSSVLMLSCCGASKTMAWAVLLMVLRLMVNENFQLAS